MITQLNTHLKTFLMFCCIVIVFGEKGKVCSPLWSVGYARVKPYILPTQCWAFFLVTLGWSLMVRLFPLNWFWSQCSLLNFRIMWSKADSHNTFKRVKRRERRVFPTGGRRTAMTDRLWIINSGISMKFGNNLHKFLLGQKTEFGDCFSWINKPNQDIGLKVLLGRLLF